MLILYGWTYLLQILISGNISYISTTLLLWLVSAIFEYFYKIGALNQFSQRLSALIDISADDVFEKTGLRPVVFTDLCYLISIIEYQYFSVYERLAFARMNNPLLYVVVVAVIYAG